MDLGSILDGLANRAPFFVFAHYAEPHEPYEAHGSVQHTASLGWNGATLETLTTSEWTLRSKELRVFASVDDAAAARVQATPAFAAVVHRELATALLKAGKDDLASVSLDRAIALDPQDAARARDAGVGAAGSPEAVAPAQP